MVAAAARSGLEILRGAGDGPMPPCSAHLGWEAIDISPGVARVRFTARPEFCNPMGHVQGGFIAAMLDDAMGPAAFSMLDEGTFAPTLEMKVTFLRPARPGTLIGEGRVVRMTGGVAFLEGLLFSEDGELLATSTATARLLPSRAAGSNVPLPVSGRG